MILSHRRNILYLQIAALDLTRTTLNALWYILWDPTEPVATRPLAIQTAGSWFVYGWDLTKNVMELYKSNGTIANSYSYAPFGEVTQRGNITNPLQWSSEFYDSELGMVYYNFRYYNPREGRWISRDPIGEEEEANLYAFLHNKVLEELDDLGLFSPKEKCCCGKKKLPDKFCCENDQIVHPKSCKIRILMGHSYEDNLKKNIKRFCKVDKIGIVSCFSTTTNTLIPISQSYPNNGRNTDLIHRGEEAARYLRAELEAAKQEAKNMCSKENKKCCSKVVIIVSDSGDKDGKGGWQVKFTFGSNPYTVIIDCDKPKPRNYKIRGGKTFSK